MLVKASFNQEITTQGESMVFIPEGIHTIHPSVNGKPKQITVRVKASEGEKIAKRIQASFEDRNNTNQVRAIFDFDHKDTGPAAALPTRFYYEKGKGVMVERELTGAGSKAIKAKNYSYFSPVFTIGKNGVPSGVPERGPLGALVNDPAFRDIPRIAAHHNDQSANQTTDTMDELVKCGLLTDTESAKPNAGEVAKQRVSAMSSDSEKVAELKTKIADLQKQLEEAQGKVEASEASILKAKEDNATSLVEAAVNNGQIASKDEDSKEFWKATVMANEQGAKQLAKLPKLYGEVTKPIVNASASNQTVTAKNEDLEGLDAVEAALAKEIE